MGGPRLPPHHAGPQLILAAAWHTPSVALRACSACVSMPTTRSVGLLPVGAMTQHNTRACGGGICWRSVSSRLLWHPLSPDMAPQISNYFGSYGYEKTLFC